MEGWAGMLREGLRGTTQVSAGWSQRCLMAPARPGASPERSALTGGQCRYRGAPYPRWPGGALLGRYIGCLDVAECEKKE